MNKTEKVIGGRACCIYEYGEPEAILLQPVDDHDLEVLDSEADHIAALAGAAGEKGFTLVAFKIGDWNRELSPWPAPPVFGDESFGDGAPETLRYITDTLLPEINSGEDCTGVSGTVADHVCKCVSNDACIPIHIGGYSFAGFFALWAAYQVDVFAGVAAASPSVWFPGWIEYAADRSILAGKAYLSLGDKEEKTRNPVMRTVGDNIRRQLEILEADPGCSECVLEMNQGNHFKEPDLRTAKGFAWLLNNSQPPK